MVRARSGSTTSSIAYTNPYQEIPSTNHDRRLFVAGRQMLWESERADGTFGTSDRIFTAAMGAKTARDLVTVKRVDGADGGWVTGVAGDRTGFVFGTAVVTQDSADQSFAVSGGGVWAVNAGVKRRAPGVAPSEVLARSGDLVALRPFAQSASASGTPIATGDVEVRSLTSGALVATVSPGSASAAAISGRTLVVLTHARLTRYSIDDGSEIAATPVSAATMADIDSDAGRVIFHTTQVVEALDVATGRVRTIVRSPTGWQIAAAAVSGRLVLWAAQRRIASGEASRRTFVTEIRRAAIRN
jgi:hypothetical protein